MDKTITDMVAMWNRRVNCVKFKHCNVCYQYPGTYHNESVATSYTILNSYILNSKTSKSSILQNTQICQKLSTQF